MKTCRYPVQLQADLLGDLTPDTKGVEDTTCVGTARLWTATGGASSALALVAGTLSVAERDELVASAVNVTPTRLKNVLSTALGGGSAVLAPAGAQIDAGTGFHVAVAGGGVCELAGPLSGKSLTETCSLSCKNGFSGNL